VVLGLRGKKKALFTMEGVVSRSLLFLQEKKEPLLKRRKDPAPARGTRAPYQRKKGGGPFKGDIPSGK